MTLEASSLEMTGEGPAVTVGGHRWLLSTVSGSLHLHNGRHAVIFTADGRVQYACSDLADQSPLQALLRALKRGTR